MYRKWQSFQFIHLFHLRAQSVEIIFKNVTRDSLGIVFWTEAGIFKLGSQNLHNNFTEVYSKVEFWNKTLRKLLPLSDITSPCPVSVLFVQEAHFPLNPYSCSHLSPAFCAAVAGWRVEGGCCVSRNNERRHISRQQQSRLWLAGGSWRPSVIGSWSQTSPSLRSRAHCWSVVICREAQIWSCLKWRHAGQECLSPSSGWKEEISLCWVEKGRPACYFLSALGNT